MWNNQQVFSSQFTILFKKIISGTELSGVRIANKQ